MSVQLRINQSGGLYDSGRNLPQFIRERVLDLHHAGFSQRGIAQELSTSRHFVQNVIRDYDAFNSSCQPVKGHKGHSVLTPDAIECIENEKLIKPSIYCTELQNRLVLDGVVHPADLPHISTISYLLRKELLMTKKRIHAVPSESKTQAIEEDTNFYLDQVSDLNVSSVHFFDEAGVSKTTMNRRYGHATIGVPAFEVQRWASNANYTINLMHSCHGVDYVSVIDGASNGNELLLFFEEAVDITRRDGSVILERGDTVIMDNCPFHHARFAEMNLRNMLAEYGVNLLFQPAYSPHFNTCELCFHQIKAFLNHHQMLAENETEIAIYEACSRISPQNSVSYFRHCGYVI
ncbi:uncharacterized protein LOC144642138 [Oculina patagonica]